MAIFIRFCTELRHNQNGATAIEYGLIAALIVIGIITSVRGALTASTNMWNNVSTQLSSASN